MESRAVASARKHRSTAPRSIVSGCECGATERPCACNPTAPAAAGVGEHCEHVIADLAKLKANAAALFN